MCGYCMKNILLTCLFLGLSFTAQAESLDIDLSSDSIRGQFNVLDRRGDVGFSAAVQLVDDEADVYSLNLRTQGRLEGNRNVMGGFGGRLFHVAPENDRIESFQALGLGGFVDFRIPELRGVIIGGEFYFAPSVVTTGDYGNFREIAVKLSYRIYQNAVIYLGARYAEMNKMNKKPGRFPAFVFCGRLLVAEVLLEVLGYGN